MEPQKVWMLLQIVRELVGFPQYTNIRAEAMKALAEIDAKLMKVPDAPIAPTAAVPRAMPSSSTGAPTDERRI